MSRLRLNSGDDHPEAATKHLADASNLLSAGRHDGAAYLSGYVAECSLKTLLLYEKGAVGSGAIPLWKSGAAGHTLSVLLNDAGNVAMAIGAKTARYFGASTKGLGTSSLATWRPEMRYRPPSVTAATATSWVADAAAVYAETVGQMIKDGVL